MTITISKRAVLIALIVLIGAGGAATAGYYYGRSSKDERAAFQRGIRAGELRAGAQSVKTLEAQRQGGAEDVFSAYEFQRDSWYMLHLSPRFKTKARFFWIDKVSDVRPGLDYHLCGSNHDEVCWREQVGE